MQLDMDKDKDMDICIGIDIEMDTDIDIRRRYRYRYTVGTFKSRLDRELSNNLASYSAHLTIKCTHSYIRPYLQEALHYIQFIQVSYYG